MCWDLSDISAQRIDSVHPLERGNGKITWGTVSIVSIVLRCANQLHTF